MFKNVFGKIIGSLILETKKIKGLLTDTVGIRNEISSSRLMESTWTVFRNCRELMICFIGNDLYLLSFVFLCKHRAQRLQVDFAIPRARYFMTTIW